MALMKVTFTGADDSVDPRDMVWISRRWPAVEWGILFSESRSGSPRYPSREWLAKMSEWFDGERYYHLSAHLCGKRVRDLVMDANVEWFEENPFWGLFDRVQLNFHGQFHKAHPRFGVVLDRLMRICEPQLIFQCDGVNDEAVKGYVGRGLGVPLFDTSGGAGLLPAAWHEIWPGKYCGYAGGLGPDNIGVEIDRISSAAKGAPFWIDMETKVRSEDDQKFDLDKCLKVLEIVRPYLPEE